MATLYLSEPNATIRKQHHRITVELDGNTVEIPLIKLERVVVVGRVHITTSALHALLQNGIDTALLDARGRLLGRVTALESRNVPLRMRQYERQRDEQFVLDFARSIVQAKIHSAVRVLQRYARNHPESDFQADIQQLQHLQAKVATAASVETVRGLEGSAAAAYFAAFGRLFRGTFTFQRRTRRPPKDPVNAVLSLAYTLLVAEAIAVASAVGFDPYVGFFHGLHYGRCSLALDLIEEFRSPVVDRLVLTLFNNRVFQESDFQRFPTGAVWLNGDAVKRFITEYEKGMRRRFVSRHTGCQTTFRRLLFGQAERLARAVNFSDPYQPYVAEP